ncbi:Hypothetical predicted protein [Olea europaea subsp. europaea]|uniref:Uncharacterized protein n=1 Tax=Olea europaea subsp. europaea TaxID=158383 RepID=A0A8S0RXR2_OLEEU|nr:Hypothetical predicted protein [Olea europaea subsp. europaea]
MCRPCPGCVMATVGMEPDFQAILVSGTRCAGNVRDASGPWKGCSLVSRQFLGHSVQAIFGMRRAIAGMQPDFSTFLGSFWDTMCKPQLRHIWALSGTQLDFQAFVGSFLGTVCRPCPRRVLVAVGRNPNFQAFVGSLWARCAGHVRDASWPRLGRGQIFRHFLAISGTQCAGCVWDASWPWQGRVLAAVGIHPDFQAFAGVLWARCAGHIREMS